MGRSYSQHQQLHRGHDKLRVYVQIKICIQVFPLYFYAASSRYMYLNTSSVSKPPSPLENGKVGISANITGES